VQRKADGNPFFIEELVKSLRETGTLRQEGERWVLNRTLDEIVVPDTVQGVLMSRIDRLEEGPRSALQLAAVIGREFTERLLDRIADLRAGTSDALRALQAVELISQKALYPELAFMFKHALAQDVAYGSLLLQRRRVLHRRVAEAIEKMYADRLGEHAAIIAHHFAAAEQWPKAAEYFDKAADHATAASAVREAISLCDRAIEALDRSNQADAEQRKAVLHQKNAGLYLLVSDFGSAHAEGEKAAAIARLLGDSTGLGSALAGMALASVFGHQFARSLAESNEAIEIGHSIRSDRILAAGRLCVGYVQCVTGNLVDAQTHYEQAYQLIQNTGDAFHQSISTTFLSRLNGWQGNYGPSVARAQEGLEIARRHNLSFPQLVAIWSLSLPQVAKGDYDDAHTTLRETLALTEKLGDEFMRIRALNTLGWLHAECGDIARAVALNEEARVLSSGRGDPETIANAELNLGDAALIQSDPAKAEEFFEHVHKLVGNPATSDWMKWRYSQHLFAGYGETRLARDDPGEAEAWANRCLELASHTNSKKYLVRGWRLKAGVARARLQWDDAEQALLRALEYAREIGNPTQLWKTWIALSEFFRDTQRPDRARAAAVGAREVIERVGLSLKTPVLREAFERSDLIRAVYRSCEAD